MHKTKFGLRIKKEKKVDSGKKELPYN